MQKQKRLPLGIENFEQIRREDFYYVDKTCLIQNLVENWGQVNLFTRPRRFGKSMNMSMLKSFFEIGADSELFQGLAIATEEELCKKYMGQFPVISISLKSVNGNDFETARAMLFDEIRMEAQRYQFLIDSDKLTEIDKNIYLQLADSQVTLDATQDNILMNGLRNLSTLLEKHYAHKVIILIDEYDVPLDKAYQMGFYDKMANLIRNVFNQALKTNDSLYFAVMTGCLRVSKESIFTGLNNLRILSITDVQFDEYFGFTDQEVRNLLQYYDLEDSYDTIRAWYDGYHFGSVDVYCPWDVISYCDALRLYEKAQPKEYWSHTSSNDIIKRFIHRAKSSTTKKEIERLIEGEAIRKVVHQELTYKELDESIDNLWSVLFTTGYLTQRGDVEEDVYQLAIPNLEIRKIFINQIYTWFLDSAREDGARLSSFCQAFQDGDAVGVEEKFNEYLMKTISIRDTFVQKARKENFYHGILLGLLSYKDNWAISSNKESGDGYSDILIEMEEEEIGIVIEVKYAEDGDLEAGCTDALQQIQQKKYEQILQADGLKKILKYGITCYKKRCRVMLEK